MRKGLILDDGAVSNYIFGWPVENGHLGHDETWERFFRTPESFKAVLDRVMEVNEISLKGWYEMPNNLPHDQMGPRASNYHLWLREIKKTFDPNRAAESTFYIQLAESLGLDSQG